MQMRAAVYHGAGDIRIEDVPVPEPGPGELLIRVAANGICGTDAHEYHSGPHQFPDHPFIPGHEFAGHVAGMGSGVERFDVGDLVACGAGISCGSCRWCVRGRSNLCLHYRTLGLQLHGGLAQYVTAPASICLEVGSLGLTPLTAALTQPMSIAVHCVSRGRVAPDEKVAVIGAGGIGVFLSYALVTAGAMVEVVERDETRRVLVGGLGVRSVSDTIQEVGEPDVVYEVTGTVAGLELALGLAGPGTRLVVVGLQEHPTQIDMRDLAIREVELIGTNAHVFAADFADAARLLSTRTEGWDDVASVVLPLDDLVARGLEPMIEGRPPAVKTLIDPWA